MTKKDLQLIQEAEKESDWMLIGDLALKADTQEAKSMIHRIEVRKYHNEEYSAGIL